MTQEIASLGYRLVHHGRDIELVATSFNDLGPDPYHPIDGGRTRRFGQYYAIWAPEVGKNIVAQLKTRQYIQKPEHNALLGNVPRSFETIEADMKPIIQRGFQEIESTWKLPENEWLIHIHQMRVHASSGVSGTPVPEGPHQDGAQFIYMVCAGKSLIEGGKSQVFNDPAADPIFEIILEAGDGLVLNDQEVWHNATAFSSNGSDGYRDMIIVGYHLWSSGKYPETWQDNVIN